MERDAEIAQIRRELDILRTRYSLYERGGRMLQFSFWWIAVPVSGIAAAAVVVNLFLSDALNGIFAAVMIAAVAGIFWLAFGGSRQPFPWIDLAAQPPVPYQTAVPKSFLRRRNDVQILQEQIAERERRLLELGVRP